MLRKKLLRADPGAPAAVAGEKDIAAIAAVLMTSEAADHPIDNLFDGRRGPGGSRWVAADPGDQEIVLVFDAPQSIRTIGLEIEEREASRTQELQVSASRDGGPTPTHLRVAIRPDKGNQTFRATLTSLSVA